ncbi:MAG: hypothetical protein ABID04_01275 [Patescibacteria group bacterium]
MSKLISNEIGQFAVKLFIVLQLVLLVSWFLGSAFFPLGRNFLGSSLNDHASQPLIWSRANFDGEHYTQIAAGGYGQHEQAFFPAYPRLIGLFQPFIHSFILSGVFISSSFFLLSLWLLAILLKDTGENEQTIKKCLLWLVVFPGSFYFVSVYTESMFLFLALLAFYFARKKNWLLAGLVAGLASATRFVGIFLLPALLFEYYETVSKRGMAERLSVAKERVKKFSFSYLTHLFKSRWAHVKNTFFILLSSWGLLAYGSWLNKTVGDFFYFIKVQPEFGAQRTVNRITMIYQVFWRYLKMIVTVDVTNPIYLTIWLEVLTAILFLILLILGWWKLKIHRSWLVFATLAYVLPPLTGTFSSMPRYILICFPCFLVLAKLKLPRWLYLLSFLLLLLCCSLFLCGYWIA